MEPTPLSQNPYLQNTFLTSKYFDPSFLFGKMVAFVHVLYELFFGSNRGILTGILSVFFIFFLAIIAYTSIRLLEIRRKEHRHLEHEIAEYAHKQKEREKKLQNGEAISRNERWVKILHYLFSGSANDWKLAIIEADAMMDSLLGERGFKGETLGDKLKGADREKFKNLTSAWEVHTIRNRIAHEGSNFELSQREAKRIVALYETIFREFDYI